MKAYQGGDRIRRFIIYFLGMLFVSAGIVLCVKCELGISPVSSIPYILDCCFPFSFGTFTMLFHLVNIAVQYVGERKLKNIRVLMQIPVAFLFGWMIDFIKGLMIFSAPNLFIKIFLLLMSIFFTAFGMHLMIGTNLAQNPPDGTVVMLSCKTGTEMGKVKIAYDTAVTATAVLISLAVLKSMEGFGIATIISAVFVGRILSVLQKIIKFNQKRGEGK